MNTLLATPAILTAIITSIVALLSLITTTILTLSKTGKEDKSNFEKTIKDKLECIYLPLIFNFDLLDASNPLINKVNKEIIMRHGYLLSNEIFDDIKELRRFEVKNLLNAEEYIALRIKVLNNLDQEHQTLRKLYEDHFTSIKNKNNISSISKIFKVIKKIFGSITISFYIILALWIVNDYYYYKDRLVDNYWLNALLVVLVFIVMLTSISMPAFYLPVLLQKLQIKTGKQRGRYDYASIVPETGMYKCIACGEESKKIKYTQFKFCDRDHSMLGRMKILFFTNIWRKMRV
ncbi:hypothetical protein [Paenibacillus sp. FSL H8-0537]|uniref:hypothetical protein n=1 Tax=Paenibacillus sp. FSL H8-0537 TaxID=2921399 RepID=UPI0031016F79